MMGHKHHCRLPGSKSLLLLAAAFDYMPLIIWSESLGAVKYHYLLHSSFSLTDARGRCYCGGPCIVRS